VIGAFVFAAAAAVSSGCSPSPSQRQAAQERDRLAVQEAEALQCLAALAERDPRQDAERDWARGDRTPIGITIVPHDPPTPDTSYEKACEYSYDGYYRPTGKWFTHTSAGYSFFKEPPSQGRCRYKSQIYASAYNARMVELAPGEVRRFCSRQKLSEAVRLSFASIATLGTAGRKNEILDGMRYQTRASLIIDTKFGLALVTSSHPVVGERTCEDCEASIGVAYLAENESGMTRRRRWPIVSAGNAQKEQVFGGGFWVDTVLTSRPLLVTRRCGWERLIELLPEGPIDRGAIRGPVRGYENISIDQSFDVVTANPGVRDHYSKVDGRFVGPHGEPPDAC
jgi:hypothetical protein